MVRSSSRRGVRHSNQPRQNPHRVETCSLTRTTNRNARGRGASLVRRRLQNRRDSRWMAGVESRALPDAERNSIGAKSEKGESRMFARACLILAVGFGWPAAALLARSTPRSPAQESSLLSEQVDLVRLLDLCAQRLKLNLEYDPTVVKGTITFRFAEAVTDEQL